MEGVCYTLSQLGVPHLKLEDELEDTQVNLILDAHPLSSDFRLAGSCWVGSIPKTSVPDCGHCNENARILLATTHLVMSELKFRDGQLVIVCKYAKKVRKVRIYVLKSLHMRKQ